jgi:hypothetical protein
MKRGLCLAAVLLSALSSGCSTFFGIAVKNVTLAPLDAASNCLRRQRLYRLAGDAFRDLCRSQPDLTFSDDYACGFEEGFVDYLEAGGNGEPPPNPPPRYRRVRFDNPAGRQAQQDYYAGFRHGSAVARDTGLRDLIIVPPGQEPAPATDPDQQLRRNPPREAAEETLPPPRAEPIGPPAGGTKDGP